MPAPLPVSAIDRPVARVEPVVLRLEPVAAKAHRALVLRAPRRTRARPSASRSSTSASIGQVVLELEPAPPLRLLLAPVPVEQVGQQAPSGRRPASRRPAASRSVRRANPGLDGLQPVAHRRRRLAVPRRPGRVPAELGPARHRLGPAVLEPRPEEPGRDAVVAVVAPRSRRASPGRRPSASDSKATTLKPGLGDRALADGHVELLDLLERVRLDRGAHALSDDVEEVDEDVAAQQPVDLVGARRRGAA